MGWKKVTDNQWEKIAEQLPIRKKSPQGGRPPADDRKCFEGIVWVLRTGAPWSELPSRYGSKSTVHRRLQEWTEKKLELLWKVF